MISEKARGLKLYMTINGYPLISYLFSWTILNVSMSLYMSILMYFCGYLSGFNLFRKAPGLLWIAFFFMSSFAISSLCLLISSIAKKSNSGYTLAYSFLMFGFIFQVFMTNPNSINMIYRDHWFCRPLRQVIEYYPGYNFIKIYSDIVFHAGTMFAIQYGRYVIGSGLTWTKVFSSYEKYGAAGVVIIPSIWNTFLLLFRNIMVIYCFVIFFEMTLASNQGVSKNPLIVVFYKCLRWIVLKRNAKRSHVLTKNKHKSVVNEEIIVEQNLTKIGESLNQNLIIDNITKTYDFSVLCGKNRNALNGISFLIKTGELVAILGENGAGKTTLINIITGYIDPSEGTAKILGFDLKNDLKQIRKLTSLCPQSDIYWEELTVFEHLRLFCILKGKSSEVIISQIIDQTLLTIDLIDKTHEQIKNLSGGMKRRLAIAISILGDPKIIIFDEPTVGLDPIKRDKILQLIKVK